MEFFDYRNNELFAENVSTKLLAETYGTPLYVYSRAALEAHYLAYEEALAGYPHLVCYAVKANSNLAVLNVLARKGAGFDIVSEGELERVMAAGGDPAKVVFSGVGKQASEMRRALDLGVYCFNVESEAELHRLNQVAQEAGKVASISLRVNPDVDAQTHPYISTGLKQNKFGIAIEDAFQVYTLANMLPGLKVSGVDCHIGSQLTDIAPFMDALDRVLRLIDELAEAGIVIEHLDLGGGLGVRYNEETPPSPQTYVGAILEKISDRKLKLLLEPGRSIAANAGILLTRVEFLKCTEEKNFAVIDAAMNDLIRPALYSAWQKIEPVIPRTSGAARVYDLVGPVCETGDFLGKDRQLILEADDLLAVRSAGAYGFVMSSNYNTRNRAAEIMVDGSAHTEVRRRETYADQLGLEKTLS